MGNFIIAQTDGSMQNGSQKFKISLTGDIYCKTLTADSIVGSVNYSTTSYCASWGISKVHDPKMFKAPAS